MSVNAKSCYTAYRILEELMGRTCNRRMPRRSRADRANRASSWRFLLSGSTEVLFRRVHLTREAPSVRIKLFGVRDIEGMGEFFSVRSTLVC